MATRPVFRPAANVPYWRSDDVEFKWHPGLSLTQKQRSITSLHDAALETVPVSRILEVSSKSPSDIGTRLSAFQLVIRQPQVGTISLESAFQGSKVFEHLGQMDAAYLLSSREARSMARDVNSRDRLVGFCWAGRQWELEPKSWFYDWLYITAVLHSMPEAPAQIRHFDGFTDIEFNPKKSFNCQARSCAIIASTSNDDELRSLVQDPQLMIDSGNETAPQQAQLF